MDFQEKKIPSKWTFENSNQQLKSNYYGSWPNQNFESN